MEEQLPPDIETGEIQLLVGLSTFSRPFLLNEAFEKCNYDDRTKLSFYMLFFGLQTACLVCVAKLPPEPVNGSTNITYKLTSTGGFTVALYKTMHKDFFEKDEPTNGLL